MKSVQKVSGGGASDILHSPDTPAWAQQLLSQLAAVNQKLDALAQRMSAIERMPPSISYMAPPPTFRESSVREFLHSDPARLTLDGRRDIMPGPPGTTFHSANLAQGSPY
jgi:hypothetical protein